MSIRHVVMWRVRGQTVAERRANALLVRDTFAAMHGQIPGLLRLEVGVDESGVDYAFDVVMVSEFESAEALAAYAQHPAHLEARRACGDLRIARHQVDYGVA
jgi:heme-degrading monooxygenase HmoA